MDDRIGPVVDETVETESVVMMSNMRRFVREKRTKKKKKRRNTGI